MCTVIIVIGVPFAVGYVLGRGCDWKYKIVRFSESRYQILVRPALWPWWFDSGYWENTLEKAKKELEIYKRRNQLVE